MSDVDNLEILSNADLRSKCKEFGLPNIPVTDSSRKVLIKKLRVSMGAGGVPAPAESAPKKTNRRETIHISKAATSASATDSEDLAKRANIRRSIATATPTKEVAPKETAAPIGVRRRSVREQVVEKVTAAVSRLSPIVIESEDEDDMVMAAKEAEQVGSRPTVSHTTLSTLSGGSRGGSLSKSSVVTTAFEASKVPLTVHEDSDTDSNIGNISQAKASIQGRFNTEFMQKSTGKLPTENLTVRRNLTQSSTSRHALDSSNYGTPSSKIFYSPLIYTGTGGAASDGALRSIPSDPNTDYDFNVKPYKATVKAPYATNFYSPSSYRNTMGSNTVPTNSSIYPNVSHLINEPRDDIGTNCEDPVQTPFLSNFARNLERLKTEPLRASGTGTIRSSGSGGGLPPRRHVRATIYAPEELLLGEATVLDSLRDFLVELDRRFGLRQLVLTIFVFLVILFLYIVVVPAFSS